MTREVIVPVHQTDKMEEAAILAIEMYFPQIKDMPEDWQHVVAAGVWRAMVDARPPRQVPDDEEDWSTVTQL